MWWYRHPSFAVTAGGSWFSRFPLVTPLFIDLTHSPVAIIWSVESAERERDQLPLAGASIICTGSVEVTLRKASKRPAVGCIDWLGSSFFRQLGCPKHPGPKLPIARRKHIQLLEEFARKLNVSKSTGC